ncbi:uncharacterized protein [Palaemon carinicauda]|uniref:uncharacterized protein isoform X2 n=1 Tax=Palaemon carinicauda TaxID=392227 RepID=UPI0035B63802
MFVPQFHRKVLIVRSASKDMTIMFILQKLCHACTQFVCLVLLKLLLEMSVKPLSKPSPWSVKSLLYRREKDSCVLFVGSISAVIDYRQTDFHETQVESDKTKLILLSRLRRLIKHERAPSPPSEFVVSTSVSGLQEDTRESNQAASSLQFTSQSQPSSSNVQFTPVSYPSDGTPEVSGGRFRGFVKRKGKHSHELKVGVTSSRTFQTSTQNTPTTPVAGHPLIYPKLPPATTLHQQSPSHLKYATKLIRKDTPTISEEDFIEISDNSYHILFNNSAEGNVNQNPTAPTYMDDMWCRTCEEPGKIQCIGHDVISILKDDEVNWIQTQLRGQDKVVGQDRNTDLSAAMSRASIASSTEYDDFNRTRVDNRKTPSEVLNMSRWSYAEIRDTVNTSCQPEVVMECYKELDRRHIEYQMTHNRKKPLNFFHKHK